MPVCCTIYEDLSWATWRRCPWNEDVAVFRFFCLDWVSTAPDWHEWVDPEERQRAQRYRRQEDRFRSLYARSLLRILLGSYLNQHPLAIRLTTGVTNKPELVSNPEWYFNIAHSGNWILLAIARASVGVDVEEVKPDFPFRAVIPFSFNTQERQYIDVAEQGRLRFYELWTRKEALVKATAQGIDDNLTQIPSLPGVHRTTTNRMEVDDAWVVGGFWVADGYPGAIAHQRMATAPQFYTLDLGLYNQ